MRKTARGAHVFVARLDDRIRSLVPAGGRVVLAYSGGLSSTLLAMLLRKRSDLECFVAGVEGSPDVHAATTARDHLDYRVEIVDLDRPTSQRIARDLQAAHPSLPSAAVHALVPLAAVRERTPGRVTFTGFGMERDDGILRSALRSWRVHSPVFELPKSRTPGRDVLRAAALSLGLPDEWSRIAHRSPANGAGLERFWKSSRSSKDPGKHAAHLE